MTTIFIDISIILGIAIGIAFLVQLLRQPMIISYIITGIVCGPLFLNLINSNWDFFNTFAEFGVILLLFLVGLSLNVGFLKRIGKVALVTGVGQVIFTSLIGLAILLLLDFNLNAAVFLAISITFSSTIIIIKLLSDKRELRTLYGRYTMGLMLVQDIIAIGIMIILPVLDNRNTFLLSLLVLLIKVGVVLSGVYLLARLVLPFILERAARSGEFLLIFTLGWCFAISGLAEWAGISLEVGAIIAGLSLGSSIYQTEISSRIKPLRDFFIALFFIILGSEMTIRGFSLAIKPSIILSIFVLIGNPFILYFLYRRMKFTRKNSFLAGLTAAQVSEFGFVLLFVAQKMGYITGEVVSVFTLVALITIFVSSYLITYNGQIYNFFLPIFRWFGKDKYKCPTEHSVKYDVLVFGYHRLGWKICESLKRKKVSFAVVDFDPMVVHKLTERGIPCFFGDATDVEFLCDIPLLQAKMIISTFPKAEDQLTLIKHVKHHNKKIIVIGNLAHIKFLDEMYDAGADYVMMPHHLAGQLMAETLFDNKWTKTTFKKLRKHQKDSLALGFNPDYTFK